MLAVALGLAACGGAAPSLGLAAAAAERIEIAATPLALNPLDPAETRVGRLTYRGGLWLASPDPRFGGWSGLRVSAEGAKLTAVSDHGYWLDATLVYDRDGGLADLREARLGALMPIDGPRARRADAEALAVAPDGSFLVSFEGRHRLALYPPADPPFALASRPLPIPPEIADAPRNGGLEAIEWLAGGPIFALAEELYEDGDHVGWIGDERGWAKLRYRATPGFQPTDAVQLPHGDVLVLERRFSALGGFAARIARVARSDIRSGARLAGQEVARLEPPTLADNFEGIAVARGSRGETLVYVVSDDNFIVLQRTLLLMFELMD
ncbi:MAG: esterase-like activity of phytase family protein [Pseudomonadota bacterium]